MSKVDYLLFNANDNDQDNIVLPFQLEKSPVRGRLVRLGSVLHDILEPHAYPDPVMSLVGESVVLALLLSSLMKYEGIFTFQAQGNGPVSMVIADITTAGAVRACATYEAERSLAPPLMGQGHLMFTVDQGPDTERYQGIVALAAEGLQKSITDYFAHSEQVDSTLLFSVSKTEKGWRGGAILLQKMPETQKESDAAEDWSRANILLETCTPKELIAEDLSAQGLLYRLFHEEGVRAFTPQLLHKGCRCTEEKLKRILTTLPKNDLDDMSINGAISMHCAFCNKTFSFDHKKS